MKKYKISIILGVICTSLYFYCDFKMDKAYEKAQETGMIVDYVRFGEISETVFISLLVLSLIASLISIFYYKEKPGFVGIIIFIFNALLFFN